MRRRFRNWITGLLGPIAIRLWMGTIRYRWRGPGLRSPSVRGIGNCIYVLWHQRLLAFTFTHRRQDVRALISRHGDGEMIARAAAGLGFKPVRGSSTRGGFQAMRELLAEGDKGFDYAIMPDGPRGPCCEFKPGAIFLASRTALPIVPITISFARSWKVPSWDRFMIPWPFTRALIQVAAEVRIPAELSDRDAEGWTQSLGKQLADLTADGDARFEELYRGAERYRRLSPAVGGRRLVPETAGSTIGIPEETGSPPARP